MNCFISLPPPAARQMSFLLAGVMIRTRVPFLRLGVRPTEVRERPRIDSAVRCDALLFLECSQRPFHRGVEGPILRDSETTLRPPNPVSSRALNHGVEAVQVHLVEAWESAGVSLILVDPPVRRIAPRRRYRRVEPAARKHRPVNLGRPLSREWAVARFLGPEAVLGQPQR